MSHLISVIVPVYNAEKYLERCIKSICNQTHENLEIILVNDGSTDDSQSICLEFLQNDSRIKYIDQENGGSSIARNAGLDNATGDIISFVDSDDHIEKDMLRIMLKLMIENQLDLIEIERTESHNTKVFDNIFKIEDRITATARIINTASFQVWKRIYKKSLIENMRFIPKIIHQDVFFTMDVIDKVSSIGYLNSPLYIYNRDSPSVIRSKYSRMKRDIAIRATEYIKYKVVNTPRLIEVVNNYIVGYYTDHYFLLSRNTRFDEKGDYRKKLKKDIFKSVSFSNINFRSLLVLLLPSKIMELISKSYQSIKTN